MRARIFFCFEYEVTKFKVAEFLNYKVSEGRVFELLVKKNPWQSAPSASIPLFANSQNQSYKAEQE
jgi:hypothetical protein